MGGQDSGTGKGFYFGAINYEEMSEHVKGVLQRKGLAKAIDEDPEKRKLLSADNDEKAIGYIKEFIASNEKPLYKPHKTAWNLWEALRQDYAQQSIAAVMSLIGRLNTFALEAGESTKAYVARFKNLRSAAQCDGRIGLAWRQGTGHQGGGRVRCLRERTYCWRIGSLPYWRQYGSEPILQHMQQLPTRVHRLRY
ncbi:hypothetical protein PLESTM_000011000 [Pleodorina starrii]|nr:hypothetical protein PLESTM_000011000 [Pleodorina starrii]